MSYAALAVGVVSIGTKIAMDKSAKNKAKRALANTPVVADPVAQVSESEKENEFLYRNAYNTGMMPGQAIAMQSARDSADAARQNVAMNTVSGSARQRASGMIQGQEDASQRQMFAQFGQQKMGALGGFSNALGRMTAEQQRVFMDQLRKYQENQATRSGLRQTMYDSDQNIGNSLMSVGGIAAASGMSRLPTGGKTKTPPTPTARNTSGTGGWASEVIQPMTGSSLPVAGNSLLPRQQLPGGWRSGAQPLMGSGLPVAGNALSQPGSFYNSQRGRYVYNQATGQLEYKYN